MKQWFDRFILTLPFSLLKKVLYVYVGAIVFWKSAPVVSLALWGIVLVTLLIIGYQSSARKAMLLKSHSAGRVEYMEAGYAPIRYWGPRLLIVAAAAALTGYFLNGVFELSGIQVFSLIVGYVLFYRETNLLGAYVAYLITNQGIGIEYIPSHVVYQTFVRFNEIRSVQVIKDTRPVAAWTYLTPLEDEQNGLLLFPSNPGGFTQREREFFIAPKDISSFLSHVPSSTKVIHT